MRKAYIWSTATGLKTGSDLTTLYELNDKMNYKTPLLMYYNSVYTTRNGSEDLIGDSTENTGKL